jgi:hypothetical protein
VLLHRALINGMIFQQAALFNAVGDSAPGNGFLFFQVFSGAAP